MLQKAIALEYMRLMPLIFLRGCPEHGNISKIDGTSKIEIRLYIELYQTRASRATLNLSIDSVCDLQPAKT